MSKEILKINVNDIIPNTYQPRRFFDEVALIELSQSIKEHGIIQPLTVRKRGEIYELVAGERRLRAAKLASLGEVPCTLVDITDTQSAQIALLENLQREDLNFIEEAMGYENLIKEHEFTQQQLAEKLGKNQSTIANKLRILRLPNSVKIKLVENNLTERHARALLKLPTEELINEVLDKVIKNELTVKKTEKMIKDLLEELESPQDSDKKQNIKGTMGIRIYLNTMKQAFDAIIGTGIEAKYNEVDKGDYMEVVVKIPKK